METFFNNKPLQELMDAIEKYNPGLITDACTGGDKDSDSEYLTIQFKFIDNMGNGEWSTGRLTFWAGEGIPEMVIDALTPENYEKWRGNHIISLGCPLWD